MPIPKKCFFILVFFFAIISCTNDNISPAKPGLLSIVGKWKVEKDSLNFGGYGLNFVKSDSDYYDFQANGILIVKEGGVIDSATYTLLAENFIDLVYKKSVQLKYLQITNGVVIKASIVNRFSGKFLVSGLASSSKLSASFYWVPPHPPEIVEGSSGPDSLRVNVVTFLSK